MIVAERSRVAFLYASGELKDRHCWQLERACWLHLPVRLHLRLCAALRLPPAALRLPLCACFSASTFVPAPVSAPTASASVSACAPVSAPAPAPLPLPQHDSAATRKTRSSSEHYCQN